MTQESILTILKDDGGALSAKQIHARLKDGAGMACVNRCLKQLIRYQFVNVRIEKFQKRIYWVKTKMDDDLDAICIQKKCAEDQRKTEMQQLNSDAGRHGYYKRGCYDCNGTNKKCPVYISRKDLEAMR